MWWIDRWMLSEARSDMTTEERGLYRELLDRAWLRDAVLPDDVERLRKLADATPEEWARSWPAVSRHFVRVDGGLCNIAQAELYRGASAAHDKRKKAGHLGGSRNAKAQPKQCSSNAQAMLQPGSSNAKAPVTVNSNCKQRTGTENREQELQTDTSAALRASARLHSPDANAATVNGNGQTVKDSLTVHTSSPAVGAQSSERAADAPAPTDRPTRKRRASPTVPDDQATRGNAEELAALWADLCGNLPQPALPLASGIRKAINAALHRDVIPIWETRFRRVAESDFLSGRKTDFRAGLLWVLGPVNAAKIDSGQYDNHAGGVKTYRKGEGGLALLEKYTVGDEKPF